MLFMLDNYDSFTFNLVQYFGELGCNVHVERNDAISVAEVLALKPTAICISPGPCDPSKAGISIELIKQVAGNIPLLGV
ncbi:MAG: anthranilate/aminodeoxychorismate synthase component II, partial [Limnobacter sp.]|nr:anthranilate/aminodeoxychorismate synthase component II [Limnobacter sp.]